MTTFNTGNAVPSTAVKDLYDNSQTEDEVVNSDADTTVTRTGKTILTFAGMNNSFQLALSKIGFESAYLTYTPGVPGVTIQRPTQLVVRSGVFYRVTNPLAVPLVLTGDWAVDGPKLTDVGDASLRAALAAVGGASLVAFTADGVSSVGTLQTKLSQIWCVDDFKTGTRTDIQATEAMLAATGGTARFLPNRVYLLHNWTYSVTTGAINLRGAGKPAANAAFTTLSETGATVLSGHIEIRAPVVNISDFGVDCGSARGYPHNTGCLTVDAPNGAAGLSFTSRNIAIMGADTTAASVSHGFLVEGFDLNEISNTDCYKLWYGIILKGRRGFIRNTRGWMMSGVGIFVKSDLPASGGNVADATVHEILVDGWIGTTYNANTTFDAVSVMASTTVLATVKVRDVQQTFGNTAVRVVGGGAGLYCAGVELDGIKAIGTYIGVEIFGTTYDVKMDNIDAENPRSGLIVKTSGASTGWQIGRMAGLYTDAAITGPYAADLGGTGSWGQATARSGIGNKRIPFTPDTVICGQVAGQMIIDGDGPLSLGGSWSGQAGNLPSLKILPGNALHFRGRFVNLVATGTSLAAIPGGVRTGSAPTYILAGKNASSADTSIGVQVGASGLVLVFPTVGGIGVNGYFDIDQIVYSR